MRGPRPPIAVGVKCAAAAQQALLLQSLLFCFGLPELTQFKARRGDESSSLGFCAAGAITFHPVTPVSSPTASLCS